MRANLPDPMLFLDKTLPSRPDLRIVALVDSGNDGHLFQAHSMTLNRDVACKIIPRSNLVHGPDGEEQWRAEVHKADALRSTTVVRFEDIGDWRDPDIGIDCIVLISEFVDGRCLRKFISTNAGEMNVAFVIHWLETMLDLFHEMDQRHIQHGDLHAGNILVEDRSSYALIGPKFVFRVTDFGVADVSSERRFKDDYLQLADILAQLLRAIDYSRCSQKEQFIFHALRNEFIGRHLVETNVTRDPIAKRPSELFSRLNELEADFEKSLTCERSKLVTPFDFLSCEQIPEDPALLDALYSDRFLGLTEIESRNNVVLTGGIVKCCV